MSTQQGNRQASFRAIGSTTTHNGDAVAAMAVELEAAELTVPTTYNGWMIAWLQARAGSSSASLPGLQALFAEQQGAHNWSSVGAFDPLE